MDGKAKRRRYASKGVPGRKDANHLALVAVFEQLGCKVADTSTIGFGFPDICIGVMGMAALVEIKNPDTFYGRQGLTESQRAFHSLWEGCTHVVRTADEAISLVTRLRRSRIAGDA